RVEIRIAVNRTESQELCVLESGNEAENALLVGNPETRLESDDVPHSRAAIFLAQLHDRKRFARCSRIFETNGFERPKAERVAPAARHFFDRHAAFEVRR